MNTAVILSEFWRMARVPGGRFVPAGVVERQNESQDLRLLLLLLLLSAAEGTLLPMQNSRDPTPSEHLPLPRPALPCS